MRSATSRPGDFVIAPFTYSDGTCPACQHGFQSNCTHGGALGNGTIDGGKGEIVRAPSAAATLVKVPGSDFTDTFGQPGTMATMRGHQARARWCHHRARLARDTTIALGSLQPLPPF